jgi:Cd2+/Zn2+-exporting ATPase
MDCPQCAAKIEKAVVGLNGIEQVEIDFLSATLKVRGEESSSALVCETVRKLGYRIELDKPEKSTAEPNSIPRISPEQKSELIQFGIAASLVGIAMWGKQLSWPSWVILSMTLVVITLAGRVMLRQAWGALLKFDFDVDVLMSVAILGAIALGEFIEAGVVAVLYATGELIENYSVDRSRRAVRSLLNLAPRKAFKLENGIAVQVMADSIIRGDLVLVKPGGIIPVDGRVTAGSSTVNQASLTGESLPLERHPGDTVMAGSINGSGAMQILTERQPGETTLDRMIALVAEAQKSRTPLQTSIEKFARYYTPSVVIAATLTAVIPPLMFGALWTTWIYRALTLLMIACPCALILATPVTLVSAMAAAARRGVLVKGGRYLEGLAGIKTFAFDKTGTITSGELAVQHLQVLDGLPSHEMLRLAAGVESHSEHPIAKAILTKASSVGMNWGTPTSFQALPGRGAKASIEGRQVMVGSHQMFEEEGLCDNRIHDALETVESQACTALLVGDDHGVIGLIGLSDRIRSDSTPAIHQLRKQGVERIVMLTGDNQRTAESIGAMVGADQVLSSLLPAQKIEAIHSLKKTHGNVAMVGDGINDSPALAAADIGIAIGGVGSDVAMETADVVLMSGNLERLPWLHRVSKRSRGIIRANIGLAIGVKGLFFALAISGTATLWMALFADTGVEVLVVLNSLRMLKPGE